MKKTIIIILSAFAVFSVPAFAAESAEISAQVFKKTKSELKEVTFNVKLHCQSCVKKLQENIAFEKGVKGLHICMEDQIVQIKYDSSKTSEERLKNAIIRLGVPVTGVTHQEHKH